MMPAIPMPRPMLIVLLVCIGVVVPSFADSSGSKPSTIDDALRRPQGSLFWIERKAGKYQIGDRVSHFADKTDLDKLTFDISNNKILANVGPQGAIRALSIYRDTYLGNCGDGVKGGWPGVWAAKDNSTYGPYSYSLQFDGKPMDLAKVDWDFRTGLLDNIFPLTQIHDPQGRFVVRLITFVPLSPDGSTRLRGVVYGLQIECLADKLSGKVIRPILSYPGRKQTDDWTKTKWATFDPYEYELAAGDSPDYQPAIDFSLAKGQTLWVPTILYASGDTAAQQIRDRGIPAWLADSWTYYRNILGRLTTPDHPFLAEFHERQVLQALQSLAMSESGKFAGSNWGSFPATRQIWMKDCFYSCLPFAALDPLLAQKLILWFDEFGVRQNGTTVAGGINHSISISVAAPLLAGLYYDRTADKTFFQQHPELKDKWARLLDALIASRQDPNVYLFPTRFISDGPVDGDYHTGSNIAVWRAVQGYARLLSDVYGDSIKAREYADLAGKIRASILAKTVITGPLGPQFVESTWRDGRKPRLFSDGEESDTTLAPFYGFLDGNDPIYLNSMRFSVSAHNENYNPTLHALKWIAVPSTSPGYNKGIAAGLDPESLFGEHGYYTEFRRVTDADGSVWWWNYGGNGNPPYGNVLRAFANIGKAAWTAGVHSALFPSRFLGLAYDAPRQTFRFAPLAAIGSFTADQFPLGADRFGFSFTQSPKANIATFHNPTSHPVTLDLLLPIDGLGTNPTLACNAKPLPSPERQTYLGQNVAHVSIPVPPGQRVELTAAPASP